MKHCVIVLSLVGLLPVSGAAAPGFPWFHTRPKPVLLDDPPAGESRIAWHGAPVYPATGRLYFKDSYDLIRPHPASKSRISDNARGDKKNAGRDRPRQ